MLTLLLSCAVIASASLIAGWLPLLWPGLISTKELSLFGSGVILGTAFLIVVPESYEQANEAGASSVAGAAIVLGFLMMLVLDIVFAAGGKQPESDVELGQDDNPSLNNSNVSAVDVDWLIPRTWFANMGVTTLGMSVHAAADGVALAAALAGSQVASRLGVLVFVSILVHKMPASFSLTSVLLAQRKPALTRRQIQRDIIIFSLAGPISAITLASLLALFRISNEPKLLAAVCLAFSGGTFVFVAAHILDQAGKQGLKDEMRGLKPVGIIGGGTLLPLLASLIPE